MAAHSPTRRALHRCIRIGRGGVGSSRTNSPYTSRPWARSIPRSWDGMASPRTAKGLRPGPANVSGANASVISSTVKYCSARR
jgi:hypothetical protein